MKQTWLTRAAVIGSTAFAAVVIAAAPAAAADRLISTSWGKMTYTDSGDSFQVCDTTADGHGVIGKLQWKSSTGSIHTVLAIDDGGDSGCDTGSYDVVAEFQYRMVLSSEGRTTVYSTWFTE
ncbi:hypothetical protein [Glycomyces sp. NPDC048151]|uniref:hypothetical protein n=1 Tax=Glycomyces sp. NPDC048151 TaxID=3364002 RepID=UPI00370FF07A